MEVFRLVTWCPWCPQEGNGKDDGTENRVCEQHLAELERDAGTVEPSPPKLRRVQCNYCGAVKPDDE